MFKLIIFTILLIIGLVMILHTTKQYDNEYKNVPYVHRPDYTGYQIAMILIGIMLSLTSFIFLLFIVAEL